MPQLSPNSFSSYLLTQDEDVSGTILTTLQQCKIQNRIATTAESKLNLIFDPDNPVDCGLQHAFLEGSIKALQLLLLDSEEALAIQLEEVSHAS